MLMIYLERVDLRVSLSDCDVAKMGTIDFFCTIHIQQWQTSKEKIAIAITQWKRTFTYHENLGYTSCVFTELPVVHSK